MSFDPDVYTITIRKENIDDEVYFVGRVAEFPNISAFENSHEEALEIIRGSLTTVARHAQETGRPLPQPEPANEEASGRITLRMPKGTHAKVNQRALFDDTSATQLINTAIACYLGEASALDTVYQKIVTTVQQGLQDQQRIHLQHITRLTTRVGQPDDQRREFSNVFSTFSTHVSH